MDFNPVPDGEYKVRITKEEVKPTKKDPNAFFCRWEMTIFGCEGQAAEYNGKKVYHNTMLTGAGSGMFRDLFMAVNKIAKKEDVPSKLECDTEDFLGKEVAVTLTQGTKEDGSPSGFNEVKAVKPL